MEQLLATKLFIPPTRPELVPRPRLVERLGGGLHGKITLISAPAGFGKTTLVTEWLRDLQSDANQAETRSTWLSLDGGDNDLARFLPYFIAALNQVAGLEAPLGRSALNMLQSPQPPPLETGLTSLSNELAAAPVKIILVLDDYHLIHAQPIHEAVGFLLENNPPQLHLVLVTREDPPLPLARFRSRGQMTELRAADLRFTSTEAADFLNRVMDLNLAADEIAALETRTEGWIAGLQLAAISMQGSQDVQAFINSFTGSHRLVLDYLMHEVLDRQPEDVQHFLLQTAVLTRLTGALCDALTGRQDGQNTLEMLDRANLFLIPLDNERRWYRYHHLFADLLQQRLNQNTALMGEVTELHKRAGVWYENHGLKIEAFNHAVAADDFEGAARLVVGEGDPLHLGGALVPVLNWLESLPTAALEARPTLWVMYASALLLAGRLSGVDEKLRAAEAALQDDGPDEQTKFLIGLTASTRAALAVFVIGSQPAGVEQQLQAAEAAMKDTEADEKSEDMVGLMSPRRAVGDINQDQLETVIAQSHRALAYFHPELLNFRLSPTWLLGIAHQLQGDLAAAGRAYTEAIALSEALDVPLITIPATIGLGSVQEAENQLYLAAETYQRGLALVEAQIMPAACEGHLGLARIFYEWNDLEAAQQHWEKSVQLARQLEDTGNIVSCEVFHARLKLAQGDAAEASAVLARAEQFVREKNSLQHLPAVAAAQVLTALHQGDSAGAAHLAQEHKLPRSQARVHLAQGDTSAALAALETLRQQVQAKGSPDQRLKVLALQAAALQAHGELSAAVDQVGEAVFLAEPGGFVRIFVDEGIPMARLLNEALSRGVAPDYLRRVLGAFPGTEPQKRALSTPKSPNFELVEQLSDRELEVLALIAEGLTNQEIAARLYLSKHTVKVHARNIYGKLGVKNRTEAVARGRELGILLSG